MEQDNIFIANDFSSASLLNETETNGIYLSELKSIHSSRIFRNFSIKCVLAGHEYYKVNGEEFRVDEGMMLISGKNPVGEVYFDSKVPVRGLCIDIKSESIAQAVFALNQSSNLDLDVSLEQFCAPNFFERTENIGNSLIGKEINELTSMIDSRKLGSFHPNEEWYLHLAEKIVLQELGMTRSMSGINTVKISTKKEILKRLLIGKAYMNENYLNSPSMAQIAREASLSEYHFFRSFRQAFDISPYQYLLGKRLEYACNLLKNTELSFSEIAIICRFPDYFTFCKAFKRKYMVTLTAYRSCKH
jgi:AraC family transcriptional regulator